MVEYLIRVFHHVGFFARGRETGATTEEDQNKQDQPWHNRSLNALLRLRQVADRCDAPRRGPKQAEGLQLVPWTDQQFNGFLEAAPDALVIAGQDGRIIRVNAQAEKLFGYPRGGLLGREVEVLIPERFRGRHVEHRTVYFANPGTRPMGAGLELYGLRRPA